jgi:radical SAM/Cys-rich protein
MDRFKSKLAEHNIDLRKRKIDILQVNVGKLCNLTCVHCHVEAGPTKIKENMTRETAKAVVRFMDAAKVTTLDITGGAPELNPNFKYLVIEAKLRNLRVIDRCNLTVFYENGMADLPDFFARRQVEIVASLPCYQEQNVDKQRGRGTFHKSIEALKWLNDLGYGKKKELVLNLVYNPVGPHLPPAQKKLEEDYKNKLYADFGIVFNELYTITNMPVTRYAKYLKAFNQYDAYAELLINSFNLSTVEGLMCVSTLSVGWDGRLYDCDFNQMLGMPIRLGPPQAGLAQGNGERSRTMQMRNGKPLTISDVQLKDLNNWEIFTGNHCFGCTAGAGSSCQGALQEKIAVKNF